MTAALALDRTISIAHAAASGRGIGFAGVSVAYKGLTVLHPLTLQVAPGEIMALIGPSGSGKTTALRAVAGFVQPTAGRITIGDTDVTDLPPYARDIGMVVQNYALFPHMRVFENVAFGLRARHEADTVIRERVATSLAMVGMESYAARFPRELSGGQQQRVAIARALAIRPRVLLLDEPLSALDAQIRRSMVGEIARLHRELPSLTILYVTHDQAEALTLGDRIAIMRAGRVVACDTAPMLYAAPPNRFAAEFLGRANLLRVVVEDAARAPGIASVRLGETVLHAATRETIPKGTRRLLCVRPHAVRFVSSSSDALAASNCIDATVTDVQWQGERHEITVDVTSGDTTGGDGIETLRLACAPLREPPLPGQRTSVTFDPDDATLIPADDG